MSVLIMCQFSEGGGHRRRMAVGTYLQVSFEGFLAGEASFWRMGMGMMYLICQTPVIMLSSYFLLLLFLIRCKKSEQRCFDDEQRRMRKQGASIYLFLEIILDEGRFYTQESCGGCCLIFWVAFLFQSAITGKPGLRIWRKYRSRGARQTFGHQPTEWNTYGEGTGPTCLRDADPDPWEDNQ